METKQYLQTRIAELDAEWETLDAYTDSRRMVHITDIISELDKVLQLCEQQELTVHEAALAEYPLPTKKDAVDMNMNKRVAFIRGWKAKELQGIKILSAEEIDQMVPNLIDTEQTVYKQAIIDYQNKQLGK